MKSIACFNFIHYHSSTMPAAEHPDTQSLSTHAVGETAILACCVTLVLQLVFLMLNDKHGLLQCRLTGC